ncbi:hypothetical protein EI94DRAFT_1706476 [Lactarius quietus]|nr:hypothetical protein EI94DRAFT_1706476 [Lactarius quietus]
MFPRIIWRGLYRNNSVKREDVRDRICAHYCRMGLEKLGVRITLVINTGCHGESSAAKKGSHLTVHFKTKKWAHVMTHHIYRSDKLQLERDDACTVHEALEQQVLTERARANSERIACTQEFELACVRAELEQQVLAERLCANDANPYMCQHGSGRLQVCPPT